VDAVVHDGHPSRPTSNAGPGPRAHLVSADADVCLGLRRSTSSCGTSLWQWRSFRSSTGTRRTRGWSAGTRSSRSFVGFCARGTKHRSAYGPFRRGLFLGQWDEAGIYEQSTIRGTTRDGASDPGQASSPSHCSECSRRRRPSFGF